MPKPSLKTAKRKEAFAKIGQAITKLGDPNVNDYHTGRESSFMPACSNDAEANRWNRIEGGPQFKTPGWIRTVKP